MGLLLGDVGLAFRARQLWTQAYDDFTEIRIPRRTMEQRLDVLVGVTMTGITRIPQPERPRVLFILHEAALDTELRSWASWSEELAGAATFVAVCDTRHCAEDISVKNPETPFPIFGWTTFEVGRAVGEADRHGQFLVCDPTGRVVERLQREETDVHRLREAVFNASGQAARETPKARH